MTWAKVDDQWFAHPKVVGLSLAARGLWATVLSWSCAKRSPFVPEHMVRFLAGGEDVGPLIADLVRVHKWHGPGHDCGDCDDPGEGWVIHGWAEYQDAPLSEKRAEAGRKGGKASGESRRREANAKQTKQSFEANDEAGALPGPSRPDPSLPDPKVKGASRKRADRATRLPDDWQPEPEPDLVAGVGGQQSADRALERFRDYWRAQGGQKGRKLDWQATWRNWLRGDATGQARASPDEPRRPINPQADRQEAEARYRSLTGGTA